MATIVPVSLGGTGSNNISGALSTLGISDSTIQTDISNVNITNSTITGLNLYENSGVPTHVYSNLNMATGTRINGAPVIDSAILNNATISAGGLTFITDNGNAFVTTARVIHSTAYTNNLAFPNPLTYNGYFAVDHAHGKAFYSDGYTYNELLRANNSIIPDRNFGTYTLDQDFGTEITALKSFMDIGNPYRQIRNITMHGALRGANTVVINENLTVGDNGFRYIANDETGDQVILGPGGILPNTLLQINGNVRINGNLIIVGATLEQDVFAGVVQSNLHYFASVANLNTDTVQANAAYFAARTNSAFTAVNVIASAIDAELDNYGSYANTQILSLRTGINSVEANVDHLGATVNTRISAVHSDLQSNIDSDFSTLDSRINTVSSNIDSVVDGTTPFTGAVTMQDDLTVQGDLVVQGDTISADVTNLRVEDPLIVLANNNPGTSIDAGLLIQRLNPALNQAWIWDEQNDGWAALQTTEAGTTAGSISTNGYQDIYGRDILPQRDLKSPNVFVTGQTSGRVVYTTTSGELVTDADLAFDGTTLTAQTVDINGGSIDGVTIGTSSVATDIRVDNLQLNGNQISSTNTDGNIVLEPNGAGKVDVGSQLTADSLNVEDLTSGRVVYTGTSGELQDDADFTFNGTTVTITTVDINGGAIDGTNIGAASQGTGNFTSLESDSLSVTNATASTSKDTGAVIITQGGLGVEGAIHAGGDVSAFNTSDYRLKHNVKTIDSALNKLDQISGVEFDWDASEAGLHYGHLKGHDVGVIAQELKEVLPEAVKERDDGYLSVDYGRVVPLLIQAIKELKAQIEDK